MDEIKKELFRRLQLLGIIADIPDIGWNRFYPADPDAEPLHPDWEATPNYGGGAYSPDGVFHPDCREQYCLGFCEFCENNIFVQINGLKAPHLKGEQNHGTQIYKNQGMDV